MSSSAFLFANVERKRSEMRSLTIDRSKGKPESPRHFLETRKVQKNNERNQIFEAHYPPDAYNMHINLFLQNLIAIAFSSKSLQIYS